MGTRLGIALSAIFLIVASGIQVSAQAGRPGTRTESVCAPGPAIRHARLVPARNPHLQSSEIGEVQCTTSRGKVVRVVRPKYPPQAKAKGIQGNVILQAVIRQDGHVKFLRRIYGQPILAKAATDAALQWIYEPLLLNGKPVEFETAITIVFKLVEAPGGRTYPAPKFCQRPRSVWVDPKIQREKIVHIVMPVWPMVFAGQMQGTVRLRACIDRQGNVRELRYLSGPPRMVQATMEAVRQWKYKPTFRDGRPVDVETTIDVIWRFAEQGHVQVQFRFAPAKVVHRVLPKYPPEASAQGIEGKVLLNAVIRKDGHVEILRKISGPPILAKAAIEAVRQWVYQPALRNGEPVEVKTTITVLFTL
jgi:TonB family protein